MKKGFIPKIGVSILSADFGYLAEEAKRIEEAGADSIHIDIMDGQFVPNLTLGPKAVSAIRKASSLFLDVHLMIYNPFDYIERFIEMGADGITFHVEATEDIEDTLAFIKKCNCKAGLSMNPETSLSIVLKFLSSCDLILFMAVHPGFSGQKFLPEVLDKIKILVDIGKKMKLANLEGFFPFDIQVDGGINETIAKQCVQAGATFLVSGDFLFAQKDLKEGIRKLRSCISGE